MATTPVHDAGCNDHKTSRLNYYFLSQSGVRRFSERALTSIKKKKISDRMLCTRVRWACSIGVGAGGGQGGARTPLSREGGRKELSAPPPHFWARTYPKIPPRSLFFHPHNSTLLTRNQSVRCFEKFIGVRTWGCWGPSPPVFLQCVCGGEGGWRGVAPHAGSPFGPVFQCPAI